MTRESMAPAGSLHVGDTAPVFQATDINGRPVDLAALRGARVWLSFLRFANCPLAQAKLDKIKALAAAFPALRPIAIGTPEVQRRPRYREAGFPVIADGEQALYRLYGAEHSFPRAIVPTNQWATVKALCRGYLLRVPLEKPWWRMPADFLIDENGRIAHAHYGRRMHDDIAPQHVQAFIEAGLRRPARNPESLAQGRLSPSLAD
jgi:peroxiredoxin